MTFLFRFVLLAAKMFRVICRFSGLLRFKVGEKNSKAFFAKIKINKIKQTELFDL
jgi:hypothetical protein